VGGGFRKPRPAKKSVALYPGQGATGFCPQTLSHARNALVEGVGLFEMTPLLHGSPFLSEEGGSATGVLITDISHIPCCDAESMRLDVPRRESFIITDSTSWSRGNTVCDRRYTRVRNLFGVTDVNRRALVRGQSNNQRTFARAVQTDQYPGFLLIPSRGWTDQAAGTKALRARRRIFVQFVLALGDRKPQVRISFQ
jgi:hypothetical protein